MANSAINISANAQEVINLRKRIDELKAALSSMRRSTDPQAYDKLNRELQTSSIRYNRLVGDIQRYVVAQQQAERATRGTESSMSNMQKMLLQIGGTTALIALGKQVIDVRAEMQMLEQSFDVLLGGKDVSKFMSELKQFAVDSPLSLTGVANAAQTLLGFNVEADKTIPIIKQIGDISMGNEERFKSLTLAFAQMSATGKLMGQDLLQMINAGFNPLQEISSKTGKSIADLKKEMENGAISSQMVADAFASATAQGGRFYGMTEKQAQGVKGLQAQLDGGLQDAFNEIGQSQEGIIAGGYKMSISLVENYDKVGKALIAIVSAYGVYKAALVASIALERVKTTVAVYDIATKQLQLGLTLKNIAAQLALNKAILANPYALAASLIVGLVVATWALYDATTTQEKAQKRLNEINEETKKQKEELSGQTEQLIGTINAETKSKLDQIIAYKELQGLFPAYLKNMDLAIFKAMKLADQQALLNNAMNENEANNLNNQLKELQSMYDRLNSTSGNGFGGLSEGVKVIDEIREKLKLTYDIDVPTYLKTQIDLLRKQRDEIQKNKQEAEIRNKPEADQIKYINEQLDILNKKKSVIEEIAAKAENLPTPFQKMALKARDALSEILGINNEISRLQNWLGAVKGTTGANYQSSYKDAEKNYIDAQKAVASIKKDSKATVDEYNKAIAAEKKAKEDFEKLGGQTKVDKSGESKAKRAKELANDEAELRKKLANESLQAELDHEQAILDAKEDSYKKQFQLNDLNYRKELQKIKEYNDQKMKEQADFITKFGKKALPEELTDKSIKEQVTKKTNQAQYNYEAADSKTEKQRLETDKQAWNEYLKAYGDYEDKRLAIIEEYREKIGKVQTQGEKALLAGNRDKELQDLDQTLIEKSDLWVRLFDDASKHTTGYITETIKKIQQLIDYMKGVEGVEIPIGFTPEQIESLKKDPEKVKEILKGLKTQVDELDTRNPFNSLIQGFKDLKKAGKDTEKQYTATNKIIKGLEGVREVVGQLNTAFTDLGMDSESSLSKVMTVMDRTASMAQTGAQIAGPWGAAIGGAIGLTTSLFSVLKKNKAAEDTEQLQDVTSKIETTNNSINRLLEKRIDLINEATAAEAGYLNTLTQEQIKQQQTYVQSMFDRLSGNEIFGKKGKNNNLSLSALMQKEGLSSMEEFVEWWNSNGVNKLIGEGYDLKNEDQWQSIVDSWEELSEAAENAEKAWKETATGISFDSLKDSLDDLVQDVNTTFSDISDSFEDHMRNAVMNFVKSSYLTKALQDWYDKFAEAYSDDVLTSDEVDALQNMYNEAYNKAQDMYDSALKAAGVSKGSTSQSASSGYSTSMSQDTGEAIEGRMTAMQMNLISIDGNVARIAEWAQPFDMKYNVDVLTAPLSALSESCQRIELMLEQNRNIAIQSYYELKDINKQTKELYPMRIDTQAIRKSLESL